MLYENIEVTTDKQYLYDNLSDKALKEIDDILEAYFTSEIDFVVPRFENGEPDFCGDFVLVLNDSNYKETGHELLVLKWIEDFEDTGYLVECMKEEATI